MNHKSGYSEHNYYPTPFAGITEENDNLFRQFPPVVGFLWRALRRRTRPGGIIEINLKDLAETIKYSLRWAREALQELRNSGFVDVLLQARNYWFRLQVNDPGIVQKTSCDREKTSNDCIKTSSKPSSNIDSVVVQDPKILKNSKTVPPTHPVENKQKLVDPITQQTLDQSTAETALRVVREANIPLNKTIHQVVRATISQEGVSALERIRNAAAVAAAAPPTRKKTGNPTNRAGLFIQALKKGWKPWSKGHSAQIANANEPLPAASPERSPLPEQPKAPDGFTEWFNLAKSIGLVIGSTWMDGELWVYPASGGCESWDYMRKLHPLPDLQELTTARHGTS